METKHLENALAVAGIKKLPDEPIIENKSFKGNAVIKIQKVGGRTVWGIGKWDKHLRKVLITQDFDGKMAEKIIEVYPYESQQEENVKESTDPKKTLKYKRLFLAACGYNDNILKSLNNARADKLIEEIESLQSQIKEITGKEVEDNTIDKLKEQLDEVKLAKEKGEA